jgi:hypothetical protein
VVPTKSQNSTLLAGMYTSRDLNLDEYTLQYDMKWSSSDKFPLLHVVISPYTCGWNFLTIQSIVCHQLNAKHHINSIHEIKDELVQYDEVFAKTLNHAGESFVIPYTYKDGIGVDSFFMRNCFSMDVDMRKAYVSTSMYIPSNSSNDVSIMYRDDVATQHNLHAVINENDDDDDHVDFEFDETCERDDKISQDDNENVLLIGYDRITAQSRGISVPYMNLAFFENFMPLTTTYERDGRPLFEDMTCMQQSYITMLMLRLITHRRSMRQFIPRFTKAQQKHILDLAIHVDSCIVEHDKKHAYVKWNESFIPLLYPTEDSMAIGVMCIQLVLNDFNHLTFAAHQKTALAFTILNMCTATGLDTTNVYIDILDVDDNAIARVLLNIHIKCDAFPRATITYCRLVYWFNLSIVDEIKQKSIQSSIEMMLVQLHVHSDPTSGHHCHVDHWICPFGSFMTTKRSAVSRLAYCIHIAMDLDYKHSILDYDFPGVYFGRSNTEYNIRLFNFQLLLTDFLATSLVDLVIPGIIRPAFSLSVTDGVFYANPVSSKCVVHSGYAVPGVPRRHLRYDTVRNDHVRTIIETKGITFNKQFIVVPPMTTDGELQNVACSRAMELFACHIIDTYRHVHDAVAVPLHTVKTNLNIGCVPMHVYITSNVDDFNARLESHSIDKSDVIEIGVSVDALSDHVKFERFDKYLSDLRIVCVTLIKQITQLPFAERTPVISINRTAHDVSTAIILCDIASHFESYFSVKSFRDIRVKMARLIGVSEYIAQITTVNQPLRNPSGLWVKINTRIAELYSLSIADVVPFKSYTRDATNAQKLQLIDMLRDWIDKTGDWPVVNLIGVYADVFCIVDKRPRKSDIVHLFQSIRSMLANEVYDDATMFSGDDCVPLICVEFLLNVCMKRLDSLPYRHHASYRLRAPNATYKKRPLTDSNSSELIYDCDISVCTSNLVAFLRDCVLAMTIHHRTRLDRHPRFLLIGDDADLRIRSTYEFIAHDHANCISIRMFDLNPSHYDIRCIVIVNVHGDDMPVDTIKLLDDLLSSGRVADAQVPIVEFKVIQTRDLCDIDHHTWRCIKHARDIPVINRLICELKCESIISVQSVIYTTLTYACMDIGDSSNPIREDIGGIINAIIKSACTAPRVRVSVASYNTGVDSALDSFSKCNIVTFEHARDRPIIDGIGDLYVPCILNSTGTIPMFVALSHADVTSKSDMVVSVTYTYSQSNNVIISHIIRMISGYIRNHGHDAPFIWLIVHGTDVARNRLIVQGVNDHETPMPDDRYVRFVDIPFISISTQNPESRMSDCPMWITKFKNHTHIRKAVDVWVWSDFTFVTRNHTHGEIALDAILRAIKSRTTTDDNKVIHRAYSVVNNKSHDTSEPIVDEKNNIIHVPLFTYPPPFVTQFSILLICDDFETSPGVFRKTNQIIQALHDGKVTTSTYNLHIVVVVVVPHNGVNRNQYVVHDTQCDDVNVRVHPVYITYHDAIAYLSGVDASNHQSVLSSIQNDDYHTYNERYNAAYSHSRQKSGWFSGSSPFDERPFRSISQLTSDVASSISDTQTDEVNRLIKHKIEENANSTLRVRITRVMEMICEMYS